MKSLLITLLFYSCALWGQKDTTMLFLGGPRVMYSDLVYLRNDTLIDYVKYNYISYYKNKKIHELGNYYAKNLSIIKNGQWIVYTEDGEIIEKGKFKDDKKVGFWHEETWRGNYKRGRKNGKWCEFDTCDRFIYYRRGKIKRQSPIIHWS